MSWASWVSCVLGIWVLISPWVLGYSNNSGAIWSSLISGVGIAVLSGLAGSRGTKS